MHLWCDVSKQWIPYLNVMGKIRNKRKLFIALCNIKVMHFKKANCCLWTSLQAHDYLLLQDC